MKIRFNDRLLMEATQESLDSVYKTYREIVDLLKTIPAGAGRAGWVYKLVEKHRSASSSSSSSSSSCQRKCGGCCHGRVEINTEEAEALVRSAEHHGWEIDSVRLKIQKDFRVKDFESADELVARCVFLGEDQLCKVYNERPMVCRNHFVTTPRANCSTPEAPKDLVADLMPELIAAAYNEVVQEKGLLADMILNRSSPLKGT